MGHGACAAARAADAAPSQQAQAVDDARVANLTLVYGLNQFGYSNFSEFNRVANMFITDAVRMGAVSGGQVNLLTTPLSCTDELRASTSSFVDTFDEAKLDAIEEAIGGAMGSLKLRVGATVLAGLVMTLPW